MQNQTKGIIYIITSAILFGVTPVMAAMTYDLGSNAMTLTFYRNLLVVPVLLVLMLIRKIPFKLKKEELITITIVGVLCRATTTFFVYFSYNYIGIGLAQTLHFLYPVTTAVLIRILYKEKLGVGKTLALVLSTMGIALASLGSTIIGIKGIVFAVISAITYAFYMMSMEKTCIRNMNATKVSCYMGLVNAIALVIIDIPQKNIVFNLTPKAFLYTFIVSICTSFFAYTLLQMGIKLIGARDAAIYSMFEPIACVLAGWIFLKETMSTIKLLSCATVLVAVFIPIIIDKNKEQIHID